MTIEPHPSGGPLRRLLPFLAIYRKEFGLALGAAIAGQGANALGPVVQKVLVDDVIVNQRRSAGPWLALLGVLAAITFALAFVRRAVGGRISLSVQHELRTAIFDRLMRLDFAGHDQLRTGQLVSRSSGDLGLIQQLLGFLPILLGNAVLVVVSLTAMTLLSPQLTVVALVALPVMGVLSYRLRTTVFPATWDAQQRAGEVAGVVDEAVTGVRVVKAFAAEDREIARLGEAAESLYRSRLRLIRLQAKATSALAAVPVFGQVAVLAFGGWLAIQGRLSLGTFLAFSSYLVQLVAPMRMMAMIVAAVQQARAGATRILDVLDANSTVIEQPDAPTLANVDGAVRFEHVRFGYQRSAPVLDDFSLAIAPGEIVALVGGSGSGKSTVIGLLPRFYDVAGGRITVDGTDIASVTLASLRAQIGIAFEDPFLFSDTVWANIAYGRADATDAEVREAARIAKADTFIEELPEQYQTVVGERGLTLSGGQRQRVALARAIVSDPRILVLDDATSAVDTETEESIHDALRSVFRGRTTILIAHRASTVRLADRVVVLDGGRVVDEGAPAELAARSATYRELLGEGEPTTARTSTPDGPGGWPDAPQPTRTAPQVLPTVAASGGRGGGRGGGGGGGRNFAANLAATPELLAALDRLPPANEPSGVDLLAAAGRDQGPEAGADTAFRIGRFIRPWRAALGLGLGLVALDAFLTVLGPVLVRQGIGGGVARGATSTLWWAAALFALVTAADWLVTYVGALVTGRTAERMLLALRVRLFAHLQRLGLDYYDNELDGRIMTRMTSDVEALSQLVQSGLVNAVVGAGTCVGVAVFLVAFSPTLALAAASVLPPLIGLTWWYQRRSSVAYETAREAIATVNAQFQENLSGVRVSQAYVSEARNASGFRTVSDRYRAARLRSQLLISLYFPGVGFLADLAAVVVLGAGAALVHRGATTPAVVIAYVLYLNLFFAPIQQLSQVFDSWQQAGAATAKITELLSTQTSTPLPPEPVAPGPLRGVIRFDDVHFAYTAGGREALSGVDLTIDAGQVVALVGETGAGKSTIVRLLARFADPTEGRVSVDGIDLRDIDLPAYRRQLGIVGQEPFLFVGTVRDNIAYGRPDASDAEVEAAARAVGAHELLAALPHGYRTEITERGRSLSAGHRQLVALARAQLVDPAILLLDEATASLDLRAEAAVRNAMSALAHRSAAGPTPTATRTTILIAHRLPTARSADRIVVLEGGRIVEDGPHDLLVAREGRYAALWAAHLGARG